MKTSRPFKRLDEEIHTWNTVLTVYNKYQSSMGALFDFDALYTVWSNFLAVLEANIKFSSITSASV